MQGLSGTPLAPMFNELTRSIGRMQDAATRQKSEQKFVMPVSPDVEPKKTSFFEIVPESPDHREKAFARFTEENLPETSVLPKTDSSERSALKRTSSSAKASVAELLLNAETLLSHGEKDLARVLVYEALKLDSKNPLALKKAKIFLNPIKDLNQLISIQNVICKNELFFENYAELAHLYYRQGNDDQALKYYHECLGLVLTENEVLFDVYKNMGNIMTKMGDFEGAEEYFHKAFTLNPDSDILSVNLGTLSIQRNDYQSALERFRSAVTKNPKNDKAWVGLSLVHHEMGDVPLAFANIESAIDINPANRTAVQLFANWCVRESRYLNAIEVVENYLSKVDLDEEISLVLVHLFCKVNKFDLAKIEAERVLLWKPEHQEMSEVYQELSRMKQGSCE